ncbi:MAG: hypothetical protein ABIH76_03295 [Candidatus Bathyarchaeota archaeon]
MKISLCSGESCCPAVEMTEDNVLIGEEGNIVHLKKHEWNELVSKIKSGELRTV